MCRVPGHETWIDRPDQTYLGFWARLQRELDLHVDAYLEDYGGYEVVGSPKRSVVDALRRRLRPAGPPALPTPADFYPARYSSPRVNALALQFRALPPAERVLSLCCGHGVFENLLRATGHRGETVSIDGQLLNLLITRRFAGRDGNYICHDVQFPLPFPSATFDGVLSSTCLPEIPAQQPFASEAIRVTSNPGWTVFDTIWNTDVMGVERVDPQRHYRFAQNFFADLADYVPMFEACAGPGRRVGVDVPDVPSAYLDGPRWQFGAEVDKALAGRADDLISVVVLGSAFPGFRDPDLAWLGAGPLAVSLAFDASVGSEGVDLVRRPAFESLPALFAPRRFGGYPETARVDLDRTDDPAYLTELYTAATVTLVPPDFTDDGTRLLPARRGHEGTGTSSRPAGGAAGG